MARDTISPNFPGLDTSLAASAPSALQPLSAMPVTTRSTRFANTLAGGGTIAALVDPFGSGSTFAAVGAIPAQLALSGSNIVRGNGAVVSGAEYSIWVVVTSPDGVPQPAVRLTFRAVLPLGGTVTPTPTPSPAPTIAFASGTAIVTEGNTGTTTVTNTINVTRNGVTGPLVVNLTTGGTATAGVDYVAGPASVTIADGANSASYMRVVNGDTTVETDETIIEQAVLAAYPSATATKTITITNDDVAVAPTLRQVATRCFRANCASTAKYARGVSYHWNRSGQTLNALRLCYQNIAKTTQASSPAGTGLEVALSAKTVMWGVEYPVNSGNFTQILWGGATSKAVALGATVYSDDTPLLVGIPDGAKFALRPWFNAPSANIGFTNNTGTGTQANTLLLPGEGVETSATVLADTSMGGAFTAGAAGLITPSAIIGMGINGAVLFDGDSLGQAYGDNVQDATNGSLTGDAGLLARSIGASRPYISVCVPSQYAYLWVANNAADVELLQWCQASISNFGVNDYDRATRTAQQVQDALTGVSTALAAKPRYQTTITPVNGSTNAAARVTVNAAIRAGSLGFTGFYEVADVVETARDSGVWKSTPQLWTADGTHGNPYSYAQVAASGAVTIPAGL